MVDACGINNVAMQRADANETILSCLTPDRSAAPLQASGRRSVLFLVGDSHAAALSGGMEAAAASRFGLVWVANLCGCSFGASSRPVFGCGADHCGRYIEYVNEGLAAQLHAGDVVAVSNGAWKMYTAGTSPRSTRSPESSHAPAIAAEVAFVETNDVIDINSIPFWINLWVTVGFLVDMGVTCNLAYTDRDTGLLVTRRSAIIKNYAATNMLKRYFEGTEIITHGAVMYDRWNRSTHGDITLVVSDWGQTEGDLRGLLRTVAETDHPFTEVLVLTVANPFEPPAGSASDVVNASAALLNVSWDALARRGVSVSLIDREGNKDVADFCTAPVATRCG